MEDGPAVIASRRHRFAMRTLVYSRMLATMYRKELFPGIVIAQHLLEARVQLLRRHELNGFGHDLAQICAAVVVVESCGDIEMDVAIAGVHSAFDFGEANVFGNDLVRRYP